MLQIIVALISFGVSGYGITLMWEGNFIPEPVWFIVLGIGTLIVHIIIRYLTQDKKRKIDRLVTVTTTIYGVLVISSFIYYNWTLDKFISATFLMKLAMVILLVLTLYINYVVMRAEISYKKKRGNQRIKEQPKETIIEKWKRRKEQKKLNEIYIVLGEAEESDDNK